MAERKKGKKRAGGRPSEYRAQFAEQAKHLCTLGATDRELAEFFQVDEATVYRWRLSHPEFCKSIKIGKRSADDRVERALYQRALGGEVTAQIFWLKNRRSKHWRDFKAVELATPPAASGRAFEVHFRNEGELGKQYLARLNEIAADRAAHEQSGAGARPDTDNDLEERLDSLDDELGESPDS